MNDKFPPPKIFLNVRRPISLLKDLNFRLGDIAHFGRVFCFIYKVRKETYITCILFQQLIYYFYTEI